jgi:exonuclease III
MDPSSILFWNVRGLNGIAQQHVLGKMVVLSKFDVVCLQETKMDEFTRLDLIRMLDPEFDSFIFLPSVGSIGGVFL